MREGVVASVQELIALRRWAPSVQSPREVKAQRSGDYLSAFRGRGMDFSEVRHYQPGDDIRHMEWRVTARSGRPHVKVYQEERERPVVLLCDFNPSMLFGTHAAFKSVVAARLAALLAWTSLKQGDRVGAFLFSATQHTECIPRAREAAVLPIMRALSEYTEQDPESVLQLRPRPLSEVLLRLRRVLRPQSLLVLISDFYAMDPESDKHLNRLAAHNQILAYHVLDRLEYELPEPAFYPVTDGMNDLLLDLKEEKQRKAYKDFFAAQKEALLARLRAAQIQYVSFDADTALAPLVHATFPRRRRA